MRSLRRMRRDLDAIELPPPAPDFGSGIDEGDHVKGEPDEVGNKPIDDLSIEDDPEHLGAPGHGGVDEGEQQLPGIEDRGPVQEPPSDDPEMIARSRDARSSGSMAPPDTRTEPMPTDRQDRPVDRDPSAA